MILNNRCEICGNPSTTALPDGTEFCKKCSMQYSVKYCNECGVLGVGVNIDGICDQCKAEERVRNINPEIWHNIDPLIFKMSS